MNDNGGNAFGNLFMVSIGIIIGFTCLALLERSAQWFWYTTLAIALVAAGLLFFHDSAMKRARKSVRANLREVAANIIKIAGGENPDKPNQDFFPDEISEIYQTVEMLNKSLIAQNSSKDNVIGIINDIALNIELDELLDDMLPKIIEGTRSNWGAFYLYNSQTEKMELKSSIGFTKNIYREFDIALGDGFVGLSAQSDKINVYNDIPDDTIYISKTFLGKIKPRSIMTVPIRTEGETVAILLLAGIYNYTEEQLEIVRLIKYYMSSAVANGLTYERTKRLKNELSFQNQLIQNMNEELESRVELRTMFWSNIINSIVDYAIIAMDGEGYILMWNKGAEALLGSSEKEITGRHITETSFETDPGETLERLKTAKNDGKCEDCVWMTQKDGSARYVRRVTTAVFNEHGEFTGYTTLIKDITTYKLLEDKASYSKYVCELLLAGSQKGLVLLNDAGLILDLSAIAAEILGRSAEELSGVSFDSLLESGGIFKDNLKICLENSSVKEWLDNITTGGNLIKISLSATEAAINGSDAKIVFVYIDRIPENV